MAVDLRPCFVNGWSKVAVQDQSRCIVRPTRSYPARREIRFFARLRDIEFPHAQIGEPNGMA